ncbi:MAG: hypothetical protein QF890_08965 [Myxococcota bacterium]|jgi:hypothetical protein|nr:hypothetical protein [bacterium]MDP6074408.1 hypothetical protein [Myxococcota bacterium]MDP6242028.1 hypothetical protein [Myxococcota bacterium]MDP7073794.1 hypothetical protein [Myxococcota bacterium]MDP7300079.1 hypothetical protein [Myxococcota bacterium]
MAGRCEALGWVRTVSSLWLFLLAAACGAAPALAAEPLSVGDVLPTAELVDQHDVAHGIDADVRVVFFSRDMDGGAVIRTALEQDPELLERQTAVYVSDLSGMPGFVRAVIVKPRLRNRPYPILLDESGAVTAAFPSREGRPTILWLEAGRIRRVAHPETSEELLALIAAGPIPEDESAGPD